MTPTPSKTPECPLHEPQCPYLDEVLRLRAENRNLADLVHTDTLTGLFNYRHFILALEQEMERTRRSGQPTALLLLDLDHFKRINDNWGHDVGNRVLVHLASLMKEVLRKVDVACRYGGEEFAVILPATPLPRAVSAARRLRQALEESPLEQVQGDPISVTMSVGVTVYQRSSQDSAEALIKEADRLLYQAKQAGRNQVAHPDLEQYRPKGAVGVEEKAALFGDGS